MVLDYSASARGIAGPVQFITTMSKNHQVILIHPDAPSKPGLGASCNGCGVCCLLEPCPLGVVLSGRRHGACAAVRWHDDLHQYRCGALSEPVEVLQHALPRPLRRLARWLAPGLVRLARRSIAAGQGCDSTVVADGPPAAVETSPTMRNDLPTGRT
jgi:hypothetical protein